VLSELAPGRLAAITAEPRRYGFHATLKPPFALAPGRSAAELEAALNAFARAATPFASPPLRLGDIGGFLALVPSAPSAQLDALAERAVRMFDAFRAPATETDRVRRAQAPLDSRERELLEAWGYPHVLDRWRFHMTLTRPLEPAERARVRAALAPLAAPVCREPLRIDGVALFVEPDAGRPFHLHTRISFECGVAAGRRA
jgi:2'-5' RNA ligase